MSAAVAAVARHLGRFELLRELGRGAQATVWLARDPRLQREVALKLLDPDAESIDEWLHEARAVSCLSHPNVVPVFEADDAGGQPYLVFEYVEGPTLAQARRQRGPWPAREAVTLLLGVLDALAAAHAQGIVHRDLKPSNVLIGNDGRARVMDFGIAARMPPQGRAATDKGDGRIVGTAGYMSPEAARAEAPAPCMDVFAAGVMLAELLAGAPLVRAATANDALRIVLTQDLLLPESATTDDALRGIVQHALARDSAVRYDGARAMHAALSAWLDPQAAAPPDADSSGNSNSTLEFLLRRMRYKTDFPALSSSVVRIQRVACSETESLASLSSGILKDVALTNKLLRMVNSVQFAHASGGGVSTVSRAVALVGFAGIRNMALAVVLLEHMGNKGHAALMAEEFARALMAGTLASELSRASREVEEAFLGSMFQSLGRLLTEYYFPEEALLIRQRLNASATVAERETAAWQVLGIGLDELGAGIARAWGLPDMLARAMRPPEGDVPSRAAPAGIERLRWLGRSANALTDALLLSEGADRAQALATVAEQHAAVLGATPRDIVAAAESARQRWVQMAQALGLPLATAQHARRLLRPLGEAKPARVNVATAAPAAATPVDRTVVQPRAGDAPAAATAAAHALAGGLQGLKAGAAEGGSGMPLNERLNLILESLRRGLDARCVVLCLRDGRSGLLVGRVSLGQPGAAMSAAFRVDTAPAQAADLFGALCARGADTLIADARSAAVAARLPAWYRGKLQAASFLLLPMMHKHKPIGLIYADRGTPIVLAEAEMQLVRQLRDEAVAALTQQAG